jgi:hypothetical protein
MEVTVVRHLLSRSTFRHTLSCSPILDASAAGSYIILPATNAFSTKNADGLTIVLRSEENMDTARIQSVVELLRAAAAVPQAVFFTYRKGGQPTLERYAEPYSLDQIENTLMVRTYQRQPDEGWRFFDVEKIANVRPGQKFVPIRPVLIGSHPKGEPTGVRTADPLSGYIELVLSTLGDMQVTPEEVRMLENYRAEHAISPSRTQAAHYRIFADCLRRVAQDGNVDATEQQFICALNGCLRNCGAAVIER